MSDTNAINAVSISSKWNNVPEEDNATPRLFDTPGYIDDFLAGLAAYTPAVNTIRLDIDQVTLRDPVYQEFLGKAADAGYQFILNFTDPNFQERKIADADYTLSNTADLLGENDGREIELDEHYTYKNGEVDSKALQEWGLESEAYDPLDYLVDGWQEILDWLGLAENAAIAEAVYGYELVNEPAAYDNSFVGGQMYFEDMAELHTRVDGWGDAKILVGGLMYSARFDKLAEISTTQPVSALDLFRDHFGDSLVWSAHYYTGRDQDADVDSPDLLKLRERLAPIGDDDVIVTEMNFDSDYNNAQMDLFTTPSGYVPFWAGWTLLQPIFSGQTDKYHYARLAEEMESDGIGFTWWSPIDIDGNLLTVNGSGSNLIQEERDAIAFALNMWMGNDSEDAEGGGTKGEVLFVDDTALSDEMVASRTLFGFGGHDTLVGTGTSDYEGLNRYNRSRDYTGNSTDPDNPLTKDNDFMGDKIYGGTGQDRLHLLSGDDFGFGNDGADKIHGHSGHDVLVGGDGEDTMAGGSGDDVLEGGNGGDSLRGGEGADLLIGGAGADVVRGGKGDDFIIDHAGADTLIGGTGDDWFEIREDGNDGQVIYGREGADTFVLSYGSNGLIADFLDGADVIDLSAWGAYNLGMVDTIAQADGTHLLVYGAASVAVDTGGAALADAHFVFATPADALLRLWENEGL